MTSLFSRLQKLRDFLVERDRRLYTRGQALTADDLSAVLNLIEAIEEIPICPICLAARIDDDEPHSRACPLAVFVSGQEEPA